MSMHLLIFSKELQKTGKTEATLILPYVFNKPIHKTVSTSLLGKDVWAN